MEGIGIKRSEGGFYNTVFFSGHVEMSQILFMFDQSLLVCFSLFNLMNRLSVLFYSYSSILFVLSIGVQIFPVHCNVCIHFLVSIFFAPI